MREKESMVFYKEWKDVLNEYSPEERCHAYEAIFDYAFLNVTPEDKLIRGITSLMRIRIDKDQERYHNICQKRAEAGKKGGKKRTENLDQCKQMQANASKCNQVQATQADNDYDNDYVYNSFLIETDIYASLHSKSKEECVLNYINTKQTSVEAFCMKHRITIAEFQQYAEDVLLNWEMLGWMPKDRQDALSRFLYQLQKMVSNIKQQKQNENKQQTDKLEQRRAVEPTSKSATEYSESF